MNQTERYNSKSNLHEIVPSTRFGQGLASLFYLKRHKKRDNYGRAPVVSRLRTHSTLRLVSSASYNTIPFEVITSTTLPPPPPIQISSLK